MKAKETKVTVKAPIVNIPKPVVKTEIIHETQFAEKAANILDSIQKFAEKQEKRGVFIKNRDPSESVPVTVTNADRTKFQEALSSAFAQSGQKNLQSGLIIQSFDYIELTYVAAGNGVGEIETATYKNGGASGKTVGTLTLSYDSNNNLSTVTKS